MTDIQNVNDAELNVPAETVPTQAEENVAALNVEDANLVSEEETNNDALTKEAIMARLQEMADSDDEISRQEIDMLKSNFYRLLKQAAEANYKAHIEAGGTQEDYVPAGNEEEMAFKELMNVVREKKAAQNEAQQKALEENYQKKLAIIERIKEILSNPDEVNRAYNDFKALQQEWNDIKAVPQEKATDLWKSYQACVEQFYDTLKLNNELRAYDFKKNLELKTSICERAEALAQEEDVVAAFRVLQQLHQEFREVGPVERDLREEVWTRFKAASTIVNKRHQDYFEARKAQENENLERKTALCEAVENIDCEALKTFADWNAQSEHVVALQAEWKTIGYAPQKMNVKIFERFRSACDAFFTRKADFFKSVRESLNTNLRLKTELCEKAEALKDSTDWKATTEALVAMQKQWREIGTVPKKYSDDIWKRFNDACDSFFDAKKQAFSSQNSEQQENLKSKQAIIDMLAQINPDEAEGDIRPQLRKAQEDWNAIGHVPFRDKEKIYKAFRAQMDRLYGALSENAAKRRINKFKKEVKDDDGRVRERLLRQYDILNNEIKTYENNLGFLTLSSKSRQGNALVEELNRKVDKLRADLDEIRQKLAALNEKEAAAKA